MLPAFCCPGLCLFVAGLAGCRTHAFALVAVYAKLVRQIFAEAFNFARRICMTNFAVLEQFLVHFVGERNITHIGRECHNIRRYSKTCSKENKGQR
jgi:hypothetical protein